MKFFLMLLAVFALAHANDEWKPKTLAEINEIRSECFKEHPLSEDLITKLQHFEFPNEEAVRQNMLCRVVKVGIFNEHDGYLADRVAKQFTITVDNAEDLEIIKNCCDKNEQGSSVDVWAYRGHTCIMSSQIGDKIKAFINSKSA